jgi:spore germination protein YaaH
MREKIFAEDWRKELPVKNSLRCGNYLRSNLVTIFVLTFLLTSFAHGQPKSLFYMTESTPSIQSFINHADKVDILVPTWYSVDAEGLLWGGPDELVMQTAKQHHVPVMPIVVNHGVPPAKPGFSQDGFHQLVANTAARQRFIDALVHECTKYGYSGFQFDFENVLWTDRDALSDFVKEAASALHKAQLQLSIATVPNSPGFPGQGGFARWIYSNWRGAYDLGALAQAVDLICLMTYDQHTAYTPPGPVAGYSWTVENLEYALRYVPKEKLSLGIPLYGYHWYAGDPGAENRSAETAATVGGNDVKLLLQTYHPQVEWDSADRSSWFYFYRDQTREWVFYTDAHTFRERYDLVKARGLQGFCSWVLGQEDAGIWDALPTHP